MRRRIISIVALVLCMVLLVGCSSTPKDGSLGVQLEDLVTELQDLAEAGGIDPLKEKSLEKAKAEEDAYEGFHSYLYGIDGYGGGNYVHFETNEEGNVCQISLSLSIFDSQADVDDFAHYAGLITGYFLGSEKKAQKVFSDLGMGTLRAESDFSRSTTVKDITFVYKFFVTHWHFEIQAPAFVEAMAAREE